MSIVEPLAGGAVIGLAASLLWVGVGRIAGISGIVGELFTARPDGTRWRWSFLVGLAVGGVALGLFAPSRVVNPLEPEPTTLLVAGALVGVGTRIGNGCTSGHGVCGIPRGSRRSLAATLTFIAVGMLTVALIGA